jgi:hypothetical protein
MGKKRLNQVKSRHYAVDGVPKVKVVPKVFSKVVASKDEVCSVCGISLNGSNRCFESGVCKSCSNAEYADIEAEDRRWDLLTDAERLAGVLFCSLAEAEQILAKQRIDSG